MHPMSKSNLSSKKIVISINMYIFTDNFLFFFILFIYCCNRLGGHAGGRKYIVRGILFKVALAETSGGLYLNTNGEPDDELAAKATSNGKYKSNLI